MTFRGIHSRVRDPDVDRLLAADSLSDFDLTGVPAVLQTRFRQQAARLGRGQTNALTDFQDTWFAQSTAVVLAFLELRNQDDFAKSLAATHRWLFLQFLSHPEWTCKYIKFLAAWARYKGTRAIGPAPTIPSNCLKDRSGQPLFPFLYEVDLGRLGRNVQFSTGLSPVEEALCQFGMAGRAIIPPPDWSPSLARSLESLSATFSREGGVLDWVPDYVEQWCEYFGQADIAPRGMQIDRRRTHFSMTTHGVEDRGRGSDGCTGYMRSRASDMMDMSIMETLGEWAPDVSGAPLYDIFGQRFLSRGWTDASFPFAAYRDDEEEGLEWPGRGAGRVLLWDAARSARQEGWITIQSDTEIGSSLLFPAPPDIVAVGTGLTCQYVRTMVLAEEGYRTRSISMKPATTRPICQGARHLIDDVMQAGDPRILAGRRMPNKMYNFARSAPEGTRWAASADLTGATNEILLSIAYGSLRGYLRGAKLMEIPIISMAYSVSTGPRCFYTGPTGSRPGDVGFHMLVSPTQHVRGFPMGEELAGTALDLQSRLVVEWSYSLLVSSLPDVPPSGWDNASVDAYIHRHADQIRLSLGTPGQSGVHAAIVGDDVSIISNEIRLLFFLRVAYRLVDAIPSEGKYLESEYVAVLAEDHAFKNADNKWEYGDLIPIRPFTCRTAVDGDPWIGHAKLLRSKLRYRLEVNSSDSRALFAIAQFEKIHRWQLGELTEVGAPVGLPPSLGGLDHPSGLLPGYYQGLDPWVIRWLFEKSQVDPLEYMTETVSLSLEGEKHMIKEDRDLLISVFETVTNFIRLLQGKREFTVGQSEGWFTVESIRSWLAVDDNRHSLDHHLGWPSSRWFRFANLKYYVQALGLVPAWDLYNQVRRGVAFRVALSQEGVRDDRHPLTVYLRESRSRARHWGDPEDWSPFEWYHRQDNLWNAFQGIRDGGYIPARSEAFLREMTDLPTLWAHTGSAVAELVRS